MDRAEEEKGVDRATEEWIADLPSAAPGLGWGVECVCGHRA
jgi:hypothetical protein